MSKKNTSLRAAKEMKRLGVVLFRKTDLRIRDHEPLVRAHQVRYDIYTYVSLSLYVNSNKGVNVVFVPFVVLQIRLRSLVT